MREEIIQMPSVALRGLAILPGMVTHFDVSRKKSMDAVKAAIMEDERIFLVTQKDSEVETPTENDVYEIGIIAKVKQIVQLQENLERVLVEGQCRARLEKFTQEEPYLQADIISYEAEETDFPPMEVQLAMVKSVQESFYAFAKANGKVWEEKARQVSQMQEIEKILDYVANNLPVHYEKKQKVLEALDLVERYEVLLALLLQEIEITDIKNEFQAKVKARVDKHQKEYLLREQMGLIREELGEDAVSEADAYEEKLAKLKAPKDVKARIKKEIARFKSISSSSSESAVSRGYIETLLEFPWSKMSKDNTDLSHAKQVLDDDHYGLEKVKERMLEFLAVRNLTKKGESPIICLVGPPGTGKTSIAQSVAKALGKEYVRICLGGVKDEAEIRGHRRTYVGAMPGRIVNGLKTAGVRNPLMLLDEIDKIGSDFKGDPASALLEVLDKQQNNKFREHYMEIPVDLSEVLFLATANDVQTIPKPLLDRMELIEVSSYTENEKCHIATEHLLPKQLEQNGLTTENLQISDEAMAQIIRSYTKEAGVRGLERKLAEVCRKTARKVYQKEADCVEVTEENLEEYLGKKRYSQDNNRLHDEIGMVHGLAWTSYGGVTLEVEVNVMPGKGEVKLTGKLGDVMKESAQAAISYIRSVSEKYQIDAAYFQEHDLHIHIPEGAVPKDGPSAGITMATAILSAVIEKPVRGDVAMTGEITLRGRVLPIGGLKEKLLAAKNAKIKTVCVPKENEKDLAEIDSEITNDLEIIPVEHLSEVLEVALVNQ